MRVYFTIDAGKEESLTSAPTEEFLDTPSLHDGQSSLTFDLRFS